MLTERHFTPKELADCWGCSRSYVQRRFAKEPGVIKLGKAWRIPESVAERVYQVQQAGGRPAGRRPMLRVRHDRDGFAIRESRTPCATKPRAA